MARTLGTMVASRLPLLDGLMLTAGTIHNRRLRAASDEIVEQIRGGGSLSAAMRRAGVFPPLLTYLAARARRRGGSTRCWSARPTIWSASSTASPPPRSSLLEPVDHRRDGRHRRDDRAIDPAADPPAQHAGGTVRTKMNHFPVTPDLIRGPASSPDRAEGSGTPAQVRGDEGKRRKRSENGFTLVELMVVIVIIGLLATIVAINVLPSGDKARVDRAQGGHLHDRGRRSTSTSCRTAATRPRAGVAGADRGARGDQPGELPARRLPQGQQAQGRSLGTALPLLLARPARRGGRVEPGPRRQGRRRGDRTPTSAVGSDVSRPSRSGNGITPARRHAGRIADRLHAGRADGRGERSSRWLAAATVSLALPDPHGRLADEATLLRQPGACRARRGDRRRAAGQRLGDAGRLWLRRARGAGWMPLGDTRAARRAVEGGDAGARHRADRPRAGGVRRDRARRPPGGPAA